MSKDYINNNKILNIDPILPSAKYVEKPVRNISDEMPFKAADNKNSSSMKEVEDINKFYNQLITPFIGKDGKPYYTVKELEIANKIYEDSMYTEIKPRRR